MWIALSFFACAPAESQETGDTGGDLGTECGETTTYDISIAGRVVDSKGKGLSGMTLYLDDRGQTHSSLGQATTAADGTATFTAKDVTAIENCWMVLDYWLVAEDPSDVTRTDEDDMNTQLFNAIDDGSLSVDSTEFPLELP